LKPLKVVMIHEVTDNVLTKDLSSFDIITFDDGLYTQYLHHKHFSQFNKPMYFFISTNIISTKTQSNNVIYCADAHIKAKDGNFENYMNWKQIIELNLLYNIGGHTHTHPQIKKLPLRDQVKIADIEIKNMLAQFKTHNITINSFCFPYNEDSIGYRVKMKGFTFFGNERIAVESI